VLGPLVLLAALLVPAHGLAAPAGAVIVAGPGGATLGYVSKVAVEPQGTPMTFVNADQLAHTVTADDSSFDSDSVEPDATFSMEFDTPETYQYYCVPHGAPGLHGMAATIVVDEPEQ